MKTIYLPEKVSKWNWRDDEAIALRKTLARKERTRRAVNVALGAVLVSAVCPDNFPTTHNVLHKVRQDRALTMKRIQDDTFAQLADSLF